MHGDYCSRPAIAVLRIFNSSSLRGTKGRGGACGADSGGKAPARRNSARSGAHPRETAISILCRHSVGVWMLAGGHATRRRATRAVPVSTSQANHCRPSILHATGQRLCEQTCEYRRFQDGQGRRRRIVAFWVGESPIPAGGYHNRCPTIITPRPHCSARSAGRSLALNSCPCLSLETVETRAIDAGFAL